MDLIDRIIASRATGTPVATVPSLEEVLTSPEWFGLETATLMQRALCRIADGRTPKRAFSDGQSGYAQDIRGRMTLDYAVGDWLNVPEERPETMTVVSGVRTGKSLIAGAAAFAATQTVDLSPATGGEMPRVSVLSIDKDKAGAIREHLLNAIERSDRMRGLLVEEPKAESLVFRHPSGRPIEVMVVAGKRAGAATVARWSAGCIFDEAPRMLGEDDGVVNLDEQRRAVLSRLLPEAQIWELGSPWAPIGPVYNRVREHHGKPSRECVVFRCAAPALNPFWWTPERCERIRQTEYDTFVTDVLGEFVAALLSLFQHGEVERFLRRVPLRLERDAFVHYVAAIDPATRSNAWTLAIGGLYHDGVRRVALAREWVPERGIPLRPKAVFAEIAEECQRYGVTTIHTDQWAADALSDIALDCGLYLRDETATSMLNTKNFDNLRTLVRHDPPTVEVPDVQHMADDLKRAQRKVMKNTIAMNLPRTADGRHCDYASVVAKWSGLTMPHPDEMPQKPPEGWTQYEFDDEQRLLAEAPVYGESVFSDDDDSVFSDDVEVFG